MQFKQWENFEKGKWCNEINFIDFIQKNYTQYI